MILAGRAILGFLFKGLPFGESPVRSIASDVRRDLGVEKLNLSSAPNILTAGAGTGEEFVVE